MTNHNSTDPDARLAFEPLVRRFETMAKIREDRAAKIRGGRSGYAEAAALETAAMAYRRCAEEVQRVLRGETPPPPSYRWD